MYRKISLILSLISWTLISPKAPPPPILIRNNSSVCWNNAAIQLLRNIKPITEELLTDKKRAKNDQKYYDKGNLLADAYIDFLTATFEHDQKAIDDAQDNLYGLICQRTGVLPGTQARPSDTINAISEVFNDLFNIHTRMYFTQYNHLGIPQKKPTHLTGINAPILHNLIDRFVNFSPEQLLAMPEYLIAWVGTDGGPYPFEEYYELIGLIDGWKVNIGRHKNGNDLYAPGGHFWTYVKDEFNNDHSWYVRNDLKLDEKDPIIWPAIITHAAKGLYKRRPGTLEKLFEQTINKRIDLLGQAFASIG